MRQVLFIPVILVMVVVSAACGGDTIETTDAAQESPIAEFLGQPSGFGFGDDDQAAAQAAFEEQERARQEVIAACMKEEGFEYIPIDPGEFMFFDGDSDLEYGSKEWTAKFGFGITTQRFSQAEVGPDLVGFDDSRFRDQEHNDPNQAIVEAMSEAEQEAYYEALYGDQDAFTFDETLSEEEIEEQMEDFTFEPGGCEGEGYTGDNMNRFYMDFSEDLDAMYERMQADPRIVEAEKEISDCVSDRGLEFSDMEGLYEQFESELSAIDQELGYPGEDLTEEDFSKLDESELEAIFSAPRELTPEMKGRLADLQEEEITLAVVVFDCGGGFAQQGDLFNEIRVEYEQEFLEDNADRLADYKTEAE
ncbi:MAG: hypothetical protein GY724_11170 [Actinomycetia bacterium]|nr:hypothetical protein [Actinomycetes bacterium]MCP5030233.1 hypothetical protein [Actinomycetes bacterium]